ncbi:unnamed protein product [Echinostoma caproni]|uniref:ABC1 domain-containing protein n=1 Tax=Echinostoma caproni TaxID=27848 RepID=A0A183AL47_9TREM|nr:unnamed protein product [Echinostoma caproni]
MQSRYSHAVGVLKGFRKIAEASVKLQADEACQWWSKSSLKDLLVDELRCCGKSVGQKDLSESAKFVVDRLNLFARQSVIVGQHLCSSSATVDSTSEAPPVSNAEALTEYEASQISKLNLESENPLPSEENPSVGSKAAGAYPMIHNLGPVAKPTEVTLSEAKERRVPSSRIGRIAGFGNESLVSPQIQKIFERVRQAADFMPAKQMRKVLTEELGPDWSDRLADFEEKPFAAASIGQVHRAKLHDGRIVAMKIQYPGVANSIDADVTNLMAVLNRFNVLPRGLFADRAIEVAKRELRAECDYLREAEYCKKFATLLDGDPVFQVPTVVDELTSSRVFTAEFMEGMVLDDCISLPQDVRNWLGEQLLRLCLKELFVFRVMQTDPNWSNFLYDPKSGKIMNDAHVEAVSILGEAFASSVPFDFGRHLMVVERGVNSPSLESNDSVPFDDWNQDESDPELDELPQVTVGYVPLGSETIQTIGEDDDDDEEANGNMSLGEEHMNLADDCGHGTANKVNGSMNAHIANRVEESGSSTKSSAWDSTLASLSDTMVDRLLQNQLCMTEFEPRGACGVSFVVFLADIKEMYMPINVDFCLKQKHFPYAEFIQNNSVANKLIFSYS